MKRTIPFLILCCILISKSAFAQQYVSGNISTGTVTNSGIIAPAGFTWSEVQNNTGDLSITDVLFHLPIAGASQYRICADDFIIPSGEAWNINSFEFYVDQLYVADHNTLAVATLNIEIWNGDPSLAASSKLYGDMTTDVLNIPNSPQENIYTIKNTNFPPPDCGPWPNELYQNRVWKIKGNINVTLGPGTYWVVYKPTTLSQIQNPYYLYFSLLPSRFHGSRTHPINSPTKYFRSSDNTWPIFIPESGCPSTASSTINTDFPFNINYTLALNNDEFIANAIKIYPNPAKDIITIDWNNTLQNEIINTIIVTDIRGVKVLEKAVNNNLDNNTSLDMSQLQKGIYLLSVAGTDNKILKTVKIVKQ